MLENGAPVTAVSRANECYNNRFQNGDLDFDGQSYVPDWPNGSPNYPTSFQYIGPSTSNGATYPQIQFESDIGGSSNPVQPRDRRRLHPPADQRQVHPFWSLGGSWSRLGVRNARCVGDSGNDQPTTVADFGKDAEYGPPEVTRYGGTIISAPIPNPQFQGTLCKAKI